MLAEACRFYHGSIKISEFFATFDQVQACPKKDSCWVVESSRKSYLAQQKLDSFDSTPLSLRSINMGI